LQGRDATGDEGNKATGAVGHHTGLGIGDACRWAHASMQGGTRQDRWMSTPITIVHSSRRVCAAPAIGPIVARPHRRRRVRTQGSLHCSLALLSQLRNVHNRLALMTSTMAAVDPLSGLSRCLSALCRPGMPPPPPARKPCPGHSFVAVHSVRVA
jgi:hypothetical protein